VGRCCTGSEKTTSTSHVDVEELKRQLKMELLGDLKTILEAQGIQFSDIAGVMDEEERRSSLASITVTPITTEPMFDYVAIGGGRSQGELLVASSPPLHCSLELNTIDKLAQPTTCNLVLMIRGNFRMEVRRWLVYPHQTMLWSRWTWCTRI
jgi:hypothetical protein